jgi:quercetin dioxygenase-like cupin family protein
MKRFGALGAAIALTLSTAAIALATPGSGVTAVTLARGTSAAAYHITAAAGNQAATQTVTFVPGGTSGWHTHPGPVVTIVQSGTLSLWYSDVCARMTFGPGQAVVVPGRGMYDLGRNEGSTNLVLVQTYFDVPPLAPLRTDAPATQCIGVSGVPVDGTTASGVTGVLQTRVTVAAGADITGIAGTDLAIQQITWGEGATSGWHHHPGQVAVLVSSGELTQVELDCTQIPHPAGFGWVDPGVPVHKATNDGNVPVVAFATYTNVPVGGATRLDDAGPPGDCGQNGQSGANEADGDNGNGGSDG